MLKCILVSNPIKYNTPIHISFLQALFTLLLSVLSFLGGKVQQQGVLLLKIYYMPTLALSTTLTNFGKENPVKHWLNFHLIKKLLIACHQISLVQDEGCFRVNMMHHATL